MKTQEGQLRGSEGGRNQVRGHFPLEPHKLSPKVPACPTGIAHRPCNLPCRARNPNTKVSFLREITL